LESSAPCENISQLGFAPFRIPEKADLPEKVRKYMLLEKEQMTNLRRISKQTLGFAQRSPMSPPKQYGQEFWLRPGPSAVVFICR
jgi:hypothetical protein